MCEYIHSLGEYLDAILSMHKDNNETIYFYRGHARSDYKLMPSVLRSEEEKQKEDFYFHQIRVQCPEAFINSNHIDQLVKMQHYGCPSRLLDITSNPLVGLYFACKENQKEKEEKKQEQHSGKVFVFALKPEELLYYDSDRVRMLSCLAELKYSEKKKINDRCEEKMRKLGYNSSALFDASNNGPAVEKLYHAIKSEVPAFEKKINIYDLKADFFVQPLKDNPRIIKQDGAFLIFGLDSDDQLCEHSAESFVSTEIYVDNQDEILTDLAALGINEATLFPEVESVAGYLKSTRRF